MVCSAAFDLMGHRLLALSDWLHATGSTLALVACLKVCGLLAAAM